MKLFKKAPDGGKNSGVTGYFLIEIKSAFSIVLLHFNKGTREAFHSHAFNAVTLWLAGRVQEHDINGDDPKPFHAGMLKYTPRSKFHKIEAMDNTWAVSLRGPWVDKWWEARGAGKRLVQLTHGRRVV